MPPVVSLKNVTKTFDDLTVLNRFNLDIEQGEFVTLLGASGCGKTTILRLIAGFEAVDSGEVLLDGQNVTLTPPHKRDVNTVFQSYALFPHLSVFDNVAFGLKIKKMPKPKIVDQVDKALDMVKLTGLESRSIQQLSGGQQQRVAIARAIVNAPKVLLFDEPLSALDYKLRKEMQLELKRLHRKLGITFLFVTHDQEEAIAMSDRIVVMNDGRIEQQGTPKAVYETPKNLFVAKFVGEINIFEGIVVQSLKDSLLVEIDGRHFALHSDTAYPKGSRVNVLLRPEDLVVYYKDEETDIPVLWGSLQEYTYKGSTVDVIVRLDSGQTVLITEFFNEDEEDIEYTAGQRLKIGWYQGWEVVLPDE